MAASSRVRPVVAPADRILYALARNRHVPSIPLITASILSKKLAEGIVSWSDVKWAGRVHEDA